MFPFEIGQNNKQYKKKRFFLVQIRKEKTSTRASVYEQNSRPVTLLLVPVDMAVKE